MIDFVRLQFREEAKDRLENILNEKPDDFFIRFGESNQIIARSTGEVKEYPRWVPMHNLSIKITPQLVTLEGSIHKFYNISFNKGNHNHDDFNYSQIIEAFNLILEHLDNFSIGRLTSLEFGFNVEPMLNVKEIIEHRVHRFNDCSNTDESLTFSKVYKEFRYTNYDFKIYDKGRQYRNSSATRLNILRTELRLRGKELGKIDIYKSLDLLLKQNLRQLFILFRKRFDEIVMIDPIPADIPERDMNLIYDYKHLDFWTKHLGPNYHSQAKYRLKKEVEDLIEDYGLNSTKKEIADLLEKKYIYLINN